MPFNETDVYDVSAPEYRGDQLWLTWKAVSGTVFQVYYGQQFVWSGTTFGTWLPIPTEDVRVHVGSVDPSEENTDFGSTLDAPARRVSLSWQGGTFEGDDIAGFHVYGPGVNGGDIDFTTVTATISAFGGGDPVATGDYSWESEALPSGTYEYCVVPYDTAGNETASERRFATQVIAVPPGPPAKFTDGTGTRLHYLFLPGGLTPRVTLQWNAAEYP